MATLDDIKAETAYALSGTDRAACGSPDSLDSAGAKFLVSVRDAVVEAVEFGEITIGSDANEDAIAEIADGAPDVYTATKWAEFVDLAAYQEDPTELGFDGSDMDKAADACLYIIAQRLAAALVEALAEDADDDQDDEDDEDEA